MYTFAVFFMTASSSARDPRCSGKLGSFVYRLFGLHIGPIGCPEMLVNMYESTLRNIPEQRRPHSHHDAAEISHMSI
jgi:hypothetical protein